MQQTFTLKMIVEGLFNQMKLPKHFAVLYMHV